MGTRAEMDREQKPQQDQHSQQQQSGKDGRQASGSGEQGNLVQLSPDEEKEVQERAALRAAVIFETVRREGESELTRPALALAFSGLAAGLSMGFSLIGSGVFYAMLPDEPWRPLVVNLGYTIGFVIVILGAQQLFTENTLTAMLPVLDDPDKMKKLGQMLRLWAIVLVSNLIGAAAIATVLALTGVFDPNIKAAFLKIGLEILQPSWTDTFWRSILAGWLIAMVVWLMPAAEPQRLWTIVVITWLVGVGKLSHIIVGSVESFYVIVSGQYPFMQYVTHWAIPVLIGNCIGGVGMVALVNYGQVVPESQEGSGGGS